MIKAVIFDLDGVLIDSEPLHCMADAQLLKELGVDAPGNYLDRFTGWTDSAMWEAIKADYQIKESIDELKAMQVPIKLKLFSEAGLETIHGIVDLLEVIKSRDIAIAIASSSRRVFIESVIEKTGIGRYFTIIVSGEDVKRSKPDPEIFLKAAGLLNVSPSECLVLEDSKSGTIAAKKAGMTCIGYRNVNSGDQDLSHADFIVDNIKEIELRNII
jgi:HAD superfamily hydrolase (TIGR01509 family)